MQRPTKNKKKTQQASSCVWYHLKETTLCARLNNRQHISSHDLKDFPGLVAGTCGSEPAPARANRAETVCALVVKKGATLAAVRHTAAETGPVDILFSNRGAPACHFLPKKRKKETMQRVYSACVNWGPSWERKSSTIWPTQLATSHLPQQRRPRVPSHVASSVCFKRTAKNDECVCVYAWASCAHV